MTSMIDNTDELSETIFEKIKKCNEQLITATQTPAEALIIEKFLEKYPLSVILNTIAAGNMNAVEEESQKERVSLVAELLNRILFNKCNLTVISPNLSGTMDYLIAGLESPFTEIQVLSLQVLNEVFATATKDAEMYKHASSTTIRSHTSKQGHPQTTTKCH